MVSVAYELEYGNRRARAPRRTRSPTARAVSYDDLIATGGTAAATVEAVESLGGRVVGCSFLIELAFLGGRERLRRHPVDALIRYDA